MQKGSLKKPVNKIKWNSKKTKNNPKQSGKGGIEKQQNKTNADAANRK